MNQTDIAKLKKGSIVELLETTFLTTNLDELVATQKKVIGIVLEHHPYPDSDSFVEDSSEAEWRIMWQDTLNWTWESERTIAKTTGSYLFKLIKA